MNKYLKYCKGLLLICLASLFLIGCGLGDDRITTGYYKDVTIKANGEFVIKDKVDDDKAKKGGLYYYVQVGEDGASKDKVTSITAMAGGEPIDIFWKSAHGNQMYAAMSKITADYSKEGYIREVYETAAGNKGLGFNGESALQLKIAQDGDNKGKIDTIQYFYAKDNKLVRNSSGIAIASVSYTKNGQINEITYYDVNGSNIQSEYGAYKLGFIYDKDNPELTSALEIRDRNGSLINNKWGFARISYEYNKAGKIISNTLFNKDGERSLSGPNEFRIGKVSHLQIMLLLMSQGLLANNVQTQYTYDDEHSGPIKISFFKNDASPGTIAHGFKGISAINLTYDENNNIVSLKFIGPNGQSISPDTEDNKINPDELRMEYDDKSNISKVSFYKNGNPLAIASTSSSSSEKIPGIYSYKYKYDNQRRPIEETYFDQNGNPTYDILNNVLKYYGTKPVYTENNDYKTIYLDENGAEYKQGSRDILVGTWKKLNSNPEIIWIVPQSGDPLLTRTEDITIMENGKKIATLAYNIFDIYVTDSGSGAAVFSWMMLENKRQKSESIITFTDANHFKFMNDTYERQSK